MIVKDNNYFCITMSIRRDIPQIIALRERVENRFGKTDAYKEHTEKTANYTKDKWQDVNTGLMTVFAEFAECKGNGSTSESSKAQAIVAKLRV